MSQGITGPFQGTQNAINTSIGNNQALAGGGGLNMGAQLGQNQLGEAQNYGQQLLSQQNPYLANYYNAAAQPMIQNYENAVAPNILGNAASTGGVGGSGMQAAFGQAQSNLGQQLGNLSANIYEPAYAQNQALAANLYGQGLGEQAGLTGQGFGMQQTAIGQTPSLIDAAYTPANQMMQSGAMGQNQIQNVLNSAYQNLYAQGQWPYTALNQLGGGLGNYPTAGTQTTRLTGGGSMK